VWLGTAKIILYGNIERLTNIFPQHGCFRRSLITC